MTGKAPLPHILALLLPSLLAAPGCSDDRPLVVATPWDRASCLGLDADFRAEGDPPPDIRWIRLRPQDDPARLLAARPDVDVLLGWPASTLETLEARGMIAPPDAAPSPRWAREAATDTGPIDQPSPMADPRSDPVARDAVALSLDQGDWRDGYAWLIERATRPEASGPLEGSPQLLGAALVTGSGHPAATAFLERVSNRFAATTPPPPTTGPIDPAISRVAAELIGATAIDAGKELRRAWSAVGRSPDPTDAPTALTEPPPWPPASIQQLRDDPRRRPLLDTLASALVEGEEARSWLLESWQRPVQPIDRALVAELAAVDGGRLIDGPRVLPWLRAEWTAWARQRFEQVARELDPGEAPR